MGINEVYLRTNESLKMVQQFARHQAYAASGVAGHAGNGNAPLVSGASTFAIAGELGGLAPEESFNINNLYKVSKTNKSEQIFRTGSVISQYYEPALSSQNFGSRALAVNSNSSLSFMRGELGVNMPLYQDAIYTNGGLLAANLNLVC